MNNEIVLKDKFVDYVGKEHQFVIAGVKISIKNDSISIKNDGEGVYAVDSIGTIGYALGIGVAICNPVDTFDEKVGVLKALGRAYKQEPTIFTQYSSQLGDSIINAVLQQEIEYIKQHPEKYIGGYLDAKDKYLQEQKLKKIESNLTDIEKVVAENVKKNSNYLSNVTEYIALWKKYGKKD